MNALPRHLSSLALVFTLTSSWAAQNIETPPIKIITNNWTSQLVLSRVTGEVFTSMGFQVEYLESSISEQWGALSHGYGHVQVEVWEGTMSDSFNRLVDSDLITNAGQHTAATREEWWYPAYVEALCPGLPNWEALRDCSALFKTEHSGEQGTYFAGPWEKPDAARIRALGLNFRVNTVEKGDDLWVELKKAVKDQRPILLFNWTPNWVESVYPGKFVEFPDYAPECETDPSWGVNSDFIHDCGNPKGGWLKKAAWPGMEETWNCAYRTLLNVDFNNAQIANASALVDVEMLTYQQAAEHWLAANKSTWQDWIPADCR